MVDGSRCLFHSSKTFSFKWISMHFATPFHLTNCMWVTTIGKPVWILIRKHIKSIRTRNVNMLHSYSLLLNTECQWNSNEIVSKQTRWENWVNFTFNGKIARDTRACVCVCFHFSHLKSIIQNVEWDLIKEKILEKCFPHSELKNTWG